jgi:hypothetical protein
MMPEKKEKICPFNSELACEDCRFYDYTPMWKEPMCRLKILNVLLTKMLTEEVLKR